MQYRRARIAGGTYFFTVNLADRSKTLLTDRIDDLRWVLRAVKRRHPFHIDAMGSGHYRGDIGDRPRIFL